MKDFNLSLNFSKCTFKEITPDESKVIFSLYDGWEVVSTEETPDDAKEPNAKIDISQINLDKLATEFAKIKNKKLVINDINQLVAMRLAQMLKTNPGRIDYYKHYQEVIEEYNRSQDKAVIEQVFSDLLQTAKDMTEEQKRYVREGFESDEELTIYDMLFKESLTKEDIKKIYKAEKMVKASMQTKNVIDWLLIELAR